MKTMKISFTLNLQDEASLEETIQNAKATIERLEKYIANGHSTEGLDLNYKFIDIIKQ